MPYLALEVLICGSLFHEVTPTIPRAISMLEEREEVAPSFTFALAVVEGAMPDDLIP